jgi:tetratricopeptide (TPR) repeat protein
MHIQHSIVKKDPTPNRKTIEDKIMKYVLFTPVFFFLLQLSGSPAIASDGNDLSGDCDKAIHVFWKGRLRTDKDQARHYQEAIELCPGYIRPHELLGNLYRKENQNDKAITYFTKAAELGTTNYKLYYLLASLLFEKGDLDEAGRNIKKSLSISCMNPPPGGG